MQVIIRDRKNEIFSGPSNTVTAINNVGAFDILPGHAHFITLIKDYIILDKGSTTEQRFEIKTGVLSVIDDTVEIFV